MYSILSGVAVIKSPPDRADTVSDTSRPACIDLRIGLGDDVLVTLNSREILQLIAHPALDHFPVRRFNESKFIDARIGGQRGNQADVGTFRRLNRTNTTVMRRMHVSHFKAGTLAR